MLTSEPITHVIYDMDGTLVDSESLLYTALDNVCKKFDKSVSFDVKQRLLGFPFKERAQQLYNDLDFNQSVLSFGQFIKELISDCLANVTQNGMELMSGAERVVQYFKSLDIPMAIATGNDRHSFNGTAQRFGDFFDNFSHAVLSGEERERIRPKPNPDIYLTAFDRFSPKPNAPSNVLVFEDNEVGVRAAIGAGMNCVYVVDKRLNSNIGSNFATLVITSLDEFRPELFGLPEI